MSRPKVRRPVARRQDVPGLAARRGAVALLDSVLTAGAMLEDSAGHGTGPERAEARRLADLTLRRLGQVDGVLQHFVDRAPQGSGLQILRLVAAELLFHGTPAHAAVDLGVRLAQSGKATGRLSGLINAVGRRIAEHGAEIIAEQDAPILNTPDWLGERLVADWGMDTAQAIATAHMLPPRHDITLKTEGDIGPFAQETGGEVLPTGSVRLPGTPQITALPGYADGAWWVQDAAASLPARLIPEPAGKRVLDLCAAPGGKTLQLSAAGADVTAVDMSDTRMQRLLQNLARTGLSAETAVADAIAWSPDGLFDAILLDAPCSATGTVRRHPDLPHRTDGKGIGKLVELQSRLIHRASGWLAPGGVLVFATCSLLRAEGEDHAKAIPDQTGLATFPVEPGELDAEFLTPEGWLRTRPDMWAGRGGLDGFFAARFRRAA
ncbi:MAG: transcription antitermination factor NusB [Pseudomonadota bacterium]